MLEVLCLLIYLQTTVVDGLTIIGAVKGNETMV